MKQTDKTIEQGKNLYELLNASYQDVKRLFVLAYFIAAGNDSDQEADIKNSKKYFIPRREIKNFNVLINGTNL